MQMKVEISISRFRSLGLAEQLEISGDFKTFEEVEDAIRAKLKEEQYDFMFIKNLKYTIWEQPMTLHKKK
jgi:hypothetical protein